jgi:hypothetical protein
VTDILKVKDVARELQARNRRPRSCYRLTPRKSTGGAQ